MLTQTTGPPASLWHERVLLGCRAASRAYSRGRTQSCGAAGPQPRGFSITTVNSYEVSSIDIETACQSPDSPDPLYIPDNTFPWGDPARCRGRACADIRLV
jgi:hypothetical protein